MKHIMLDLETMGTHHNALVCSIGAVYFDPETQEVAAENTALQFHEFVNWGDAVENGRKFESSTVAWWMQQSTEARAALLQGCENGGQWRHVLGDLAQFVGSSGVQVWSNGATFDVAIMEHAYNQANMAVPWQYSKVRDMRTIVWMAKPYRSTVPREGVKHDALWDAVYQARVVNDLYKHIKGGK